MSEKLQTQFCISNVFRKLNIPLLDIGTLQFQYWLKHAPKLSVLTCKIFWPRFILINWIIIGPQSPSTIVKHFYSWFCKEDLNGPLAPQANLFPLPRQRQILHSPASYFAEPTI